MYDAIVIGARCAGASTAMLLARAGHRVLLVDRAEFPSDVPQGHFIHKHGPALLARWGLLDRVVATGCPAVTTQVSDFGDVLLVGRELSLDGVAWGYGPRRSRLDRVLVDAAVEAGAEFRPRFLVEDYAFDGNRVTGIKGRDARTGTRSIEQARITIGADGRNSPLARAVHTPQYEETPALTCWYFSYWSGVPSEGFEMYLRRRRMIFSFLTNDGLFAVFVAWPIEEFDNVRLNTEGEFLKVLDMVPDLAGRVRAGRREERFCGTADVPNFLRRPFGPGWALAGDAGSHKDPFMALGICDAFRDAALLSEAVHQGLAGDRSLGDALAGYEAQRDRAVMNDYRQNMQLARFLPLPPEILQLRRALYGNQVETRRFIMANEGMIPPAEFFNPQNFGRILLRAGRGQPASGAS